MNAWRTDVRVVRVLAFTLCTCLAGCQTTGDPRAGGLFGWDETKAERRLQNLRLQQMRSDQEYARLTAATRQNTESLAMRKRKLEALRKLVATEEARTRSLRAQVDGLSRNRSVRANELAKLRETLSSNERLIDLRRTDTALTPQATEAYSEKLKRGNDSLSEALLQLLSD